MKRGVLKLLIGVLIAHGVASYVLMADLFLPLRLAGLVIDSRSFLLAPFFAFIMLFRAATSGSNSFRLTAWLLYLGTFGLVSVLQILLERRRTQPARWVAQGRCGNCGYDIRVTPECCPECGTRPGGA